MAVTLTSTPANGILTAFNRWAFVFTRDAGEPYIQLRVTDQDSNVVGLLKPIPFNASTDQATIFLEPFLQDQSLFLDDTENSGNAVGGVTTGTIREIILNFTLEFRTDVTAGFTSIGTTYDYAPAVRQIGDAPNLEDFNAIEGGGGSVSTGGKYLTKFERKKLFWFSDVQNPSSTSDIVLFQNQNVYAFDDAFSEMTFRARWFLGGSLLDTDSYTNTAPNTTARGKHPVWEALKCYQYDKVIIDAISSNGDTIVSITYDIVRVCNNPILIKFINAFGAWETWAFEGRAPFSIDVEAIDEYQLEPSNLATATETGRYGKKTNRPSIDVRSDNLRLDEAIALQDLLTQTNVLIYTGEFTGGAITSDWKGCRVRPSSFSIFDKYDTRHIIELTLELNEVYTLSN